jgi:hypothetical protein
MDLSPSMHMLQCTLRRTSDICTAGNSHATGSRNPIDDCSHNRPSGFRAFSFTLVCLVAVYSLNAAAQRHLIPHQYSPCKERRWRSVSGMLPMRHQDAVKNVVTTLSKAQGRSEDTTGTGTRATTLSKARGAY